MNRSSMSDYVNLILRRCFWFAAVSFCALLERLLVLL